MWLYRKLLMSNWDWLRNATSVQSDYTFGDVLVYTSPQDSARKTLCVFIRNDAGRAVVFFQHAEWAARVSYCCLSKKGESCSV